MDPYLEPFWGDVHARLLLYCSDQIHDRLPGDMTSRVEQSLQIDADDGEDAEPGDTTHATYFPNVQLTESAVYNRNLKQSVGGTATLTPLRMNVPQPKGRTLRIRTDSGELVTTIEFLSPGNRGSLAAKQQFRARQQYLLAAHVNLVEVLLLRGRGFPLTMIADEIPAIHADDYRIVIVRAASPDEADFYPVSIRSPLPTIPIPLRKHEAETYLELQPLIEQAYKYGGYAKTDYRKPPPVDLGPDAAWVEDLLKPRRG